MLVLLGVLFWLLYAARIIWEVGAFLNWVSSTIRGQENRLFQWIAYELKIFYWPGGIYCWTILAVTQGGDNPLIFGPIGLDMLLSLLVWKWFKDQDDDRWKKRRQKLAEKVSVVAGRLVVTPA